MSPIGAILIVVGLVTVVYWVGKLAQNAVEKDKKWQEKYGEEDQDE